MAERALQAQPNGHNRKEEINRIQWKFILNRKTHPKEIVIFHKAAVHKSNPSKQKNSIVNNKSKSWKVNVWGSKAANNVSKFFLSLFSDSYYNHCVLRALLRNNYLESTWIAIIIRSPFVRVERNRRQIERTQIVAVLQIQEVPID